MGRIISSNTTLPILNNILIRAQNGQLEISSTNLEIAITTHVRCKIEENGEVTVTSKTFTDLVNNLPNKNISIQTINNQIEVEAENYHTSIKTLPAEEFPLIPVVESKQRFSVDSQLLKQGIDQVVFAAATNQTQPEITGVLVSVEGGLLKLVATDRYRLAEKKIELSSKGLAVNEFIVPQKTISELSRVVGGQKGEVEIVVSETQVSFSFNDTLIVSRLVDGQYPDYKQIIPTDFTTTVTVERQALVGALKATSIFSQSTNSVKFEYSKAKQQLTINTESQELGKSLVDIGCKVEGGDGSLILNHHYVAGCLSSINSDNVIIKILNDNSPSLILPEGDGSYLYLVMPIKS